MTDEYTPSRETTEGWVYNLLGGDWDATFGTDPLREERLVVNLGPQHPSTHGVLRLVLELEGETITDARVVVGYLHTGIEKNCEYRTWTETVQFLTRADYLSPFYNEAVHCLAVERLLGVDAPPRVQLIRILTMEINRLASHWVWLTTSGMELGALTAMTNGFRARERCMDDFEMISGLRMNHGYIRPGGVSQELPENYEEGIRTWVREQRQEIVDIEKLLTGQTIWVRRLKDVGWLGVEGCLALGVTGPMLRAAGLPWDLRKTEPYLGYVTAWVCPADAIYVEGADNTAEARYSLGERYAAMYEIDCTRCIFCGMCVEAFPTRSLTMSNRYELALDNRQDLIYTREQLMAPLLPGMEPPPHPMRLGDSERDYYTVASQAPLQHGVPESLANPAAEPVIGHAIEVGQRHG